MPVSEVYTFPATPTQTGVGPASVGTGNGFTVTLYVVGLVAVHPLTLVYFTVTVFAPVVVHVTVTVLFPVPPPAVIVPPADTVHKLLLMPASVVYTFTATPAQTGVGPASVGTGNGFTVSKAEILCTVLPCPSVTIQ